MFWRSTTLPHSSAVFAVAFALMVIGLPVAGLSGTPDEPAYEGHPLSYWLQDIDPFSSQMVTPLKDEARTAVAHIGTMQSPFCSDGCGRVFLTVLTHLLFTPLVFLVPQHDPRSQNWRRWPRINPNMSRIPLKAARIQ